METLLHIGLSNAVAAVLLALVIAGVALACRRPAVRHGLWLLVLLKLLTPPLFVIHFSWPGLDGSASPPEQPEPVVPLTPGPEPIPLDLLALPAEPDPVGAGAAIPAGPAVELPPVEVPPPPEPLASAVVVPWTKLAVAAWLLGSAGWYGLALVRLRSFRRLLKHACRAPDEVQAEAGRLAAEMGLQRAPTVWLLPGRIAPMLWAGLGAPRLLLPVELLERVPAGQLSTLLVHELAHLRRGDHWVRLLEFVVHGLYWWHPVVWYASRELREAEEQCCDAWVVTTVPGSGRTYATALVETLDFLCDSRPPAPLLASGIGHVSDLKRRLRMIMGGTTPRALTWGGCLAVLVVGGCLLPVLPTWAQTPVARPPEPATPAAVAPDPVPTAEKPEAVDSLRSDLKKLEHDLQKKLAEVRDIERKLQDVRSKVKTGPGDKGPAVEIKIIGLADTGTGKPGERVKLPAQKPGQPLEVILRFVDGKWVVVSPPPEPGKPVLSPYYTGPAKLPGTTTGMRETLPAWIPQPNPPVYPPVTPTPQFSPQGDTRLENLEKKLKELEHMIRDLKRSSKPDPREEGALSPTKENRVATEADLQFQAAKLFKEGKYVESLRLHLKLAETSKDGNVVMRALTGKIQCCAALNQPDAVRKGVAELRDRLGRLDEADREKWRVWLHVVDKEQDPRRG